MSDDERTERDDAPAEPGDDAPMPDGDQPLEESGVPFGDDDDDVSADVQTHVTKLESAVWHAPQGKGTRIAAVLILILLAGSLIALTVLAIVTAMS